MVAAPAMRQVRHPRDGFATDFTDREVWSLALRRRDAYGVAGRSGLGADGAGPPFGLDSALVRLDARLARGAALGEGQRLEPPEPDDPPAVAADPVLVPRQTLERCVDLRASRLSRSSIA